MIQEAALNDLRASLRGAILTPADAGYDEVRRTHNGMRATYDALRPYVARESYANYQTEDDGANEQAYGPNYERLVALKNKFDPTNVFHLNNNVGPTA